MLLLRSELMRRFPDAVVSATRPGANPPETLLPVFRGSLDPDVTFVSSCVPALCDHNGRLVGRCNGYPHCLHVAENR